MGKRKFTEEQLSAINTRDRSLLVSAAAGSGKTATLTERIIRSLTDEENPEDISQMLIVTFTNAAVAEMRERITSAIKEKLTENPENLRLERQLYMLPSARISTIDSFCNDILKNNAERFGISPKYRIADPIEADILSRAVLSSLIEAAYNGELSDEVSPEKFAELSECLVGAKNDSALEDVFMLLYEKSKSHAAGVEIYRDFAEKLKEFAEIPVEENPYGEYAISKAKETVSHFLGETEKLIEFENHTKLITGNAVYSPTLEDDVRIYYKILQADTYSEMKCAISEEIKSLPSVRGEKSELQQNIVKIRTEQRKKLVQLAKRYFEYDEAEWKSHILTLSELLTTLASFIEKFHSVYFGEKKSRAMLEYSDIERLAYLSLYNDDGTPSELAISEREKYSSVYIDEYQDVNTLQNKIFLAVSRKDNRFTVGDIKQSIYGFRNARPDIFADMKNSYPPLENSHGGDRASIFMSKNFRCDKGIVDFVNDIFDNMFDLCRDSIGYVSADRLEFAKIYDSKKPRYRRPEIILFEKGFQDPECDEGDFPYDDPAPLWIAKKIKELTEKGYLNSKEKIKPSDIAIVVRKNGGRIAVYKEALESVGIKVKTSESKNFFQNPEIQLALCLLNSINNPMRDIYLAGLMLSPIFSFTPDELYLARQLGGASLWDSVKRYSEKNPKNDKFSDFISKINRYRTIAEGVQVDTLLLRLYNETGLLAIGAKRGSRENLMLLYNYARKFESSSFEGLYNFINYVNTVIESGASFSQNNNTDSADAVTIITVHKSKGLEWPVVFLADAEAPLVSRNERGARVAFSDELGVAMKTRVRGGLALVESPIHNIITDRSIERSIEEELRVYYVALTRARERLYVVGAPDASGRFEYEFSQSVKKMHQSSYTLKELKTFIDILYSQKTSANIKWQRFTFNDAEDFLAKYNTDKPVKSKSQKGCRSEENISELLRERFTFKYPYPHATRLPQKLSISNLYPAVLDGLDEEIKSTIDEVEITAQRKLGRLPEFITGSSEYESARRGIATHNFMQFFDAERFSEIGTQEEIKRLIEDGFISKEVADRIRRNEIELFLNSELLCEMKRAKNLYREFRFSVMLPAPLFTESEEKKRALSDKEILLQGVIDCIIEDGDGDLHLIDYKTDRLTREELSDKTLAQKSLSDKHSLQLSYYALATQKIFGKYPKTVRIYSLPLGDTVDLINSPKFSLK